MRALFLTSLLLAVADSAAAEDRRIIAVVEKASSEDEIKESFAKRFGAVRVIHSEDKKHVAFAHDKASGVILEDVYVYGKQDGAWVLIGMKSASRRACASVSAKDGSVSILDQKGAAIARFELR